MSSFFAILSYSTSHHSCTLLFFFFNDTAPPEISPLPLHAALPISLAAPAGPWGAATLPMLCDFPAPVHVVLGHVLPAVVFALLGVTAGARVLALRKRT